MSFLFTDRDLERARDGRTELEVATVTYEGDDSSLAVKDLQGYGWPGQAPLLRGQSYVALVPDDGRALVWLENRQHVAVSYDPADTAEQFVTANYLPPAVFGRHAHGIVQDVVFEHLNVGANEFTYQGVRDQDMEENRRELREIAGLPTDDVTTGKTPAQSIKSELYEQSRSDLQDAVHDLGVPEDSEDDVTVATAGKRALADVLAGHDPVDVWRALPAMDAEEREVAHQ